MLAETRTKFPLNRLARAQPPESQRMKVNYRRAVTILLAMVSLHKIQILGGKETSNMYRLGNLRWKFVEGEVEVFHSNTIFKRIRDYLNPYRYADSQRQIKPNAMLPLKQMPNAKRVS
jgi:hypothetical protein